MFSSTELFIDGFNGVLTQSLPRPRPSNRFLPHPSPSVCFNYYRRLVIILSLVLLWTFSSRQFSVIIYVCLWSLIKLSVTMLGSTQKCSLSLGPIKPFKGWWYRFRRIVLDLRYAGMSKQAENHYNRCCEGRAFNMRCRVFVCLNSTFVSWKCFVKNFQYDLSLWRVSF